MDALVKQYMGEYEEAMEKLDEIPGIGKQSVETILAETGLDMSRFPSEKHLSVRPFPGAPHVADPRHHRGDRRFWRPPPQRGPAITEVSQHPRDADLQEITTPLWA